MSEITRNEQKKFHNNSIFIWCGDEKKNAINTEMETEVV